MKTLALTILVFFMCQCALADGTVEVPRKAQFTSLEIKNHDGEWESIKIPKVKKRVVSLPAGEYKYKISLRSAISAFDGTMTVTDGGYLYIHQAITPDEEKVYSWASDSTPQSDAFESEKLQRFCVAVTGYGDKLPYMVDACMQLIESDNAMALLAAGYLYEKGIAGVAYDRNKASELYLRAYELGLDDAGVSYFALHQDSSKGREILYDVASRGHEWAIGAAGQLLAFSENPEDRARAREFAAQSLSLGNPVGFRTMSQSMFMQRSESVDFVIEAAAFLNLYAMNTQDRASAYSKFKVAIEERLMVEDFSKVVAKTIGLSDVHINSGYYLLVDLALLKGFAERGELSLVLNKTFSMPLSEFEGVYAIELMPTDKYHQLAVYVDDQFGESATYLVGEFDDNVACITVDPDQLTMDMTTNSADADCPKTADGAASMWRLVSQYE